MDAADTGTLDDLYREFEHEQHEPMAQLVDLLRRDSTLAKRLRGTTSMLTLLLYVDGSWDEHRLVVTYGDGRCGGRPQDTSFDRYDFQCRASSGEVEVLRGLSRRAVVERLESLLRGAEGSRPERAT
jgi:hypothetical protein